MTVKKVQGILLLKERKRSTIDGTYIKYARLLTELRDAQNIAAMRQALGR